MAVMLTSLLLKKEFKNIKTSNVHLSHFDLKNIDVNIQHNIEYIDNNGVIVTLKERGFIKHRDFKQVPRRSLKFEKL